MLEGPQLRLRPLAARDLEPLAALINEQQHYGDELRFQPWPLAELQAGYARDGLVGETHLVLIVERRADGELLGTAHIYPAHPFCRIPEIGLYLYRPEHRRRGYGFEATALLVGLLFATRPVPKVQLATDAANRLLIEVLTHFGFVQEAVLRHVERRADRWRDYAVLALSREVFEQQRGRPEVRFLLDPLFGEQPPDAAPAPPAPPTPRPPHGP